MRPLPLLLSALFLALPAAADDSVYAGNDAEKETRFRRLFTPLELSLFLIADKPAARDPVVAFYDEAKVRQVKAHQTDMLAALDGASPDYTRALRGMAGMRSILMAPAAQNYVRASEAAAASNAAFSPFEQELLRSYILYWNPGGQTDAPLPETARGRALLRAETRAYLASRPTGRVDYMAALRAAQANTSAAMGADEAAHARLFAAAGMTRPAAAPADPRTTDPSDRAARLRMALPEPQYTALERSILAAVLTDEAFAQVVAGRFTGDLKREALDAANLAMADQASPEIQAAIRGKTIFRPGSLAGLRTSIPPADMSRYVCGAMGAHQGEQRAPALVGGRTAARAALEASAAEADVIRVETTALPGIARYCQESASLRAPPPDTRPVQPQQRLRTDAPPGPATAGQNVAGRPVDGSGSGGLGGMLGGLWEGAKANAPYMIGGAVGGLIVAAALGGGPLGLAAGLALGAGVGLLLGIFGGGKGGG